MPTDHRPQSISRCTRICNGDSTSHKIYCHKRKVCHYTRTYIHHQSSRTAFGGSTTQRYEPLVSQHEFQLKFEEHTVGNIVRRILRLIREEWAAAAANPPQDDGDNNTEDGNETTNKDRASKLRSSAGALSNVASPATQLQIVPGADSQYSLSNFVLHGRPHRDANMFSSIFASGRTDLATKSSKSAESIRPALVSAIEEVLDDLDTVFDTVSTTAKDHIHSE